MRSVLLFAGLGGSGGPPMAQLRELYRQPANSRLFAGLICGVEAALDRVGRDVYERFLPAGLPLREWLVGQRTEQVGRVPHSIVEGLCSHILHLCLLQPGSRDLGDVVSSLGHSLGLWSALAAGMMVDDQRAYVAYARKSAAAVTIGLLRAHQAQFGDRPDARLVARYRAVAGDRQAPGPMAAVTGVDHDRLRDLVEKHNADGAAPPVEIALVNSASSHVLSGSPATLLAFWVRFEHVFARPGTRWSYMPVTAPFHSSIMESIADLLADDVKALEFDTTASDLAVPVYTTTIGNLQHSANLYLDAAMQIVCRPQDWPTIVDTAVRDSAPDQLVDFGPGAAVQAFTRICLRGSGRTMRYVSATALA